MNLIGFLFPVHNHYEVLYHIHSREGRPIVKEIKGDVEKAYRSYQASRARNSGDASNRYWYRFVREPRVSMPGMMDTVLNLFMNDDAVEAIAKKSGNARFGIPIADSYRCTAMSYWV